ncbi:MAG: winged helix-turn-helix domain-containing protein [Ferruginibacter sp.]|nr:winged helix-turn-helix domain-containing protein [Ferruginibacter sp.]
MQTSAIIDRFAFINVFRMDLKQLEKISKALGDLQRLKILFDMSTRGGTIQCAEIMSDTELAQPSISHHIKILIEAGLITPEKEGRHYAYTMNDAVLNEYIQGISVFAST